MALTVRYSCLIRYVADADRTVNRLRDAFAGSEVAVVVNPGPAEPNRLPDWIGVHFTAEHGHYRALRSTVMRTLSAAGLAGELKPEDAWY